ncbi:latent-transforming growth factor beta-binding protein 4 isoform X3 [Lampris incognitus]|uniref:latent-transforming growth factor beta-binding protein 4 isoform X3 n=1 Tax=Lampris incognitus TaxID=2546036 RepID=UPI0024B4DA5E|nr:latent-transforming growth factor beta-binding protein 4 isoform X3 [Lampris incognitus]
MLQPRVLVLVLPMVCFFLNLSPLPADGQTGGRTGGAGGIGGAGGGADRIQVMFTPSVCKVRCSHGRCVNVCERGNVTSLYNSQPAGERDSSPRSGFRVFLCPLLCKNGGVCIQKDRCLCPPNFTGKFCQIYTPPSLSSTNEIVKHLPAPSTGANLMLTHSEYLLPLQNQEAGQPGAPGSPMVKVRVQHPPEANVKIHQVLKLSRYSPSLHARTSSSQSGTLRQSAGAPAPAGGEVQAQTVTGDGTYTQHSGFKYCFRAVKDSQCSSPLPGLRSKDTCCRGLGKAWGITECVLCPPDKGQGNSSCPAGFDSLSGTHCSAQSVISEEKSQCYRVLGSGMGPASCSLPILRNITKQICCCSRVGKAWGPSCQRCPYFGSVAFKEICPAGPGYHYSASALQFSQRAAQQLEAGGPRLVTNDQTRSSSTAVHPFIHPGSTSQTSSSGGTRSQQQSSTSGQTSSSSGSTSRSSASSQAKPNLPSSGPSQSSHSKPPSAVGRPHSRPQQPGAAGTTLTMNKALTPGQAGAPQTPHTRPATGGIVINQPRPSSPLSTGGQGGRGDSLPVLAWPEGSVSGSNAAAPLPTPPNGAAVTPTPRPATSHTTLRSVCETRPGVCGHGRCVDQPGGRHTCVCDQGYRPNPQHTYCQDVNECVQSPGQCPVGECVNMVGSYRCVCPSGYRSNTQQTTCQDVDECQQSPCNNGHCENTAGSFKCVCVLGYRLEGNTCTDVNECEDPLQCPGQECVNSPGSYRCVSCQPGYGLLNGLCTDIDECQQSPCSGGRCENTPGSYRCVCRRGYKLQDNRCTDIDECVAASQCPGQMCVNSEGSYRCVSCRPGYTLSNRQCIDVDECSQTEGVCGRDSQCENTAGGYRCHCGTGYQLHNNICTDINECEVGGVCVGQECVNTEGSYSCVNCKEGFHSTNGHCTDVDECQQSPCEHGHCENTDGSFKCVCLLGYRLEGFTCTDIDECLEVSQCPGQMCVNSQGSYRCVSCQPGYRSSNGTCQDVDECVSGSVCGPERVCVNTLGSFRCDCLPGYRTTGLGRQCRDINECLEGEFCFPRGECVNTQGSYQCVCAQGYTLSANKTTCIDVDECVRQGVCQDGNCVNTEGSFVCECQTGFTTNPERTACLDVDECVTSEGSVCGSQQCENTIGSFRCVTSCQPGYRVTHTGECVDLNECANKTVCGQHAFCQNLIGTYQCVCDQGYTSTRDGKACVDEDECVSMLGVCGTARCENVEGSFMCECDREGEEFDTRTGQCVSTTRQGHPASSETSSSSQFIPSSVGVSLLPPLPAARPGELRECYYNLADSATCSLLATNTTQQECCCTLGEAWGLGCQYDACPALQTAEFLSLCPSGRGYVTSGAGAFSYRDVDECKRFHPEVCKSGACVNNIPGYTCYCNSGYVYDPVLLECVDHDECEAEESCPGGVCVNTVGSYYCSCQPPLVLDDTQRNCVNSSDLTLDENVSFCWQHVTADLVCQSPLMGFQVTYIDCCCLYGEGWGLQCALCPASDSEDYANLCSSVLPPPFPDPYRPEAGPALSPDSRGRGGAGPPFGAPYGSDSFPVAVAPGRDYGGSDYDDYTPSAGSRPGFRGRTPGTYRRPGYGVDGYYDEGDYAPPDSTPPRPPSFRLPADPRSERAFGVRPPPPSRPEGLPLSLAPLPGAGPYTQEEEEEEEEEEPWRAVPPFPPFTDRREGPPQRVYERRYDSFAGLNAAEDCGILHGCENGRCIRVSEGYTCDCYHGYQLDMTSMTCRDVNECEDSRGIEYECVNARCVNTEGSFRCVCRRGYIMSRRPNHCVAA